MAGLSPGQLLKKEAPTLSVPQLPVICMPVFPDTGQQSAALAQATAEQQHHDAVYLAAQRTVVDLRTLAAALPASMLQLLLVGIAGNLKADMMMQVEQPAPFVDMQVDTLADAVVLPTDALGNCFMCGGAIQPDDSCECSRDGLLRRF